MTRDVTIEDCTFCSTPFYEADESGHLDRVEGAAKITGTVTSLEAPSGKRNVGKVRFDLEAGSYTLKGDLDVILCL